MTPRSETRSQRWNLRVASDEDELVRQAAEQAEEGLTSFVRGAAVEEAKRVLADRRSFVLDHASAIRFNELLDRPARVPEGLTDLFSEPSVFDET